VHWLGGFGFDLDEMRDQWERGSVDEIHDAYFGILEQMIEERPVDIIGHADVIKVFGFHAPRVAMDWYRRLTPKIKASGMAVEVSTAGWRKPVREVYPAPEWLAMLVEAEVPLVLSSPGAGYVARPGRSSPTHGHGTGPAAGLKPTPDTV
jgi:histidinol-phosphatase (PHP family)